MLSRHRAGMHAVALALLGHRADAEDAVQDAMLVAVRRIDDLRDPDAAGPWLRAIVRNACRARLRTAAAVPLPAAELPAPGPTPEELLERRALRDWVWHVLNDLSELVCATSATSPPTTRSPHCASCPSAPSAAASARPAGTRGIPGEHGRPGPRRRAALTRARRREAEELIPGARLTVLDESGHMGHLEQPEEFVGAIVAFVSAGRAVR
nr:sigma factor [Herbidospora sakaeratensis]